MLLILLNALILLTIILTGCASPPALIDVNPSLVPIGRAEIVKAKFDQDIENANFSVIPGGPYIKKTTYWNATKVVINQKRAWSINNTKEVSSHLITSNSEANNGVVSLSLNSIPKNLGVNNNLLAVSQNRSSVYFFDIKNLKNIRKIQSLNMQQPVTHLHLSQSYACVSNERNELFFITLNKPIRILAIKKLQETTTALYAHAQGCLVMDSVNGMRIFQYEQRSLGINAVFKSNFISHQASISDNILYIADGNTGLTILEYQNNKLLWQGSYNKLGNITHVANEDQQVLTYSDDGVLTLFDTSNLDGPLLISNFRLNTTPLLIKLINNIAHIYTNKRIIEVDFSVASSPVISNFGVNMGGSRRAYLENNLMYVADWFSGMHIYDVSQPREPKLLSSFHTPGSPKGVIVRNGFAFICDDDHGLQIVDVTNPLKPIFIAHLPLSGLAYTMDLKGDTLYIASHRGGFHIVDIKDERKPKLLGSFDTPGKAWAIKVKNKTAFIADDESGLLLFDVKNPKSPRQIAQFSPGGFAEDVEIRGNTAFVAFFDDGLYILDISNETKPKVISHLKVPGNSRGISLDKDKLYLASWKAGIHVIDVNNLKKPVILSHYDTRGFAWGINKKNDIAYVLDWWGGIKLFDVSQNHTPHLIGAYQTKGKIHKIAIKNKYLFLANGSRGMQVFDNRNALNPIWVTGVDFPGTAKDIVIKNDYAYIAAGDGGLVVAHIANPFQSIWINQIAMKNDIDQLVLNGNTLLAGQKGKSLAAYDISIPDKPVFIRTIDFRANALSIDEKNLYVSDSRFGVVTTTVKDLIAGVQKNQQISNERPEFLAKLKHFLVTARSHYGIKLFNIETEQNVKTAFYPLSEKITGFKTHEDKIFLTLDEHKLVILKYQHQQLRLETEIVSAQAISKLAIVNDEIYFAGDNILSSAVLPPSINITQQNTEIQLNIPPLMPRGAYHLVIKKDHLSAVQIPNIFSVNIPKTAKSTFTMEDLKKKMQQKSFVGKSP